MPTMDGPFETHENSYATALAVRFRSFGNARRIVTGNFTRH